jgi:hypothetical protein
MKMMTLRLEMMGLKLWHINFRIIQIEILNINKEAAQGLVVINLWQD